MVRDRVVDWLLEPDGPSVRYLALARLLWTKETHSDALAKRHPGEWWVSDGHPKSVEDTSTNYTMVARSVHGATRSIPEARPGHVPGANRLINLSRPGAFDAEFKGVECAVGQPAGRV